MKIVIAPDKFKGSLTAFEVCRTISAGINRLGKKIDTVCLPMADGGDGFAAIMQYYLQTETIHCDSVDPLRRPVSATYQWQKEGETAIIELAVASGLVLLANHERNPMLTSTYGTGLLIRDAMQRGAKKIILGLGGSATNDGGIGILEALGFQLLDRHHQSLQASGANLSKIERINVPTMPSLDLVLACDVKNKLLGPEGASYVYGPQKGASPEQVKELDGGLKNLAGLLLRQTGKDIKAIEGSGAAGGIAASLLAFFKVELKQGIDMIFSASKIDQALEGCELVITGEGKIDRQSLDGKVIGRVAREAGLRNIPAIAFCGGLELTSADIRETGLAGVYPIGKGRTLSESMRDAGHLLEEETGQVIGAFAKEHGL